MNTLEQAAKALVNGDKVEFASNFNELVYDKLSENEEFSNYMTELDKYSTPEDNKEE